MKEGKISSKDPDLETGNVKEPIITMKYGGSTQKCFSFFNLHIRWQILIFISIIFTVPV